MCSSDLQTIEHCDDWYNCYDAGTREKLVMLLETVTMLASTTTTQASLTEYATEDCPGHGACYNPDTMNVEALECNCFDNLNAALQGKSDEEKLAIACSKPKVCCKWRREHCSAESQSLLARRSNKTAANEIGNSNKDSLDTSLQVKTCE